MFGNIHRYLHENYLLNPNQSGFRPNNSCAYQIIEITHNICSPFDCDPTQETRAVFLDISKAFNKVWNKSLLFKHSNGLLSKPGVLQGSILGHLLFLIHIDDLSDGTTLNVKPLADDTSIFSTICDINFSASNLYSYPLKISEWTFK